MKHATICMAKCVHPSPVVKIKSKSFSVLARYWLY